MKETTDFRLLAYILLGLLLFWILVVCGLIAWLKERETPQMEPSTYYYQPFQHIQTTNPDSMCMMLYCRGTKPAKDSLFRLINGL